MSLPARIRQIARMEVKGYVSTLTNLTQTSIINQGGVGAGKITGFDGTQYSVLMSDNTIKLVPPGGLKPLSIGTTVIVGGGVIVG